MIITVTLNTSIDKLYMLDNLQPYTVMRVKEVNNTAGGKGLNVSRIAAQAGEPVTAMGFVGGFIGQYFESLITQPLIQKAFTHVQSETRSCINGWDIARNSSTEYLEPGAPVTAEEVERFLEDFVALLPKADAVTISGSMPSGVPKNLYARLISLCREQNKPVLLDTSGETLRLSVQARPTFIKPNTDEIAQLLGRSVSSREALLAAAMELHHSGIDRVVVSLGAEGALMVSDEGIYQGRPPQITPVNTVGCGDSMVGGFAIGYARGWSALESLRYAIAVSAANALSMATGSYSETDLQALLPKVEIEKITQ
ncbi:MAG: 1-phosphofructokinase [Eubacteriales bacterium]|nr:1-phosphofructokinase [Eubacteriales bacterium]